MTVTTRHTIPDGDDDGLVDPIVIGRRIRHLRTARGMTLEDLGAAVGRAPSQV
jgi:hypothetical protein